MWPYTCYLLLASCYATRLLVPCLLTVCYLLLAIYYLQLTTGCSLMIFGKYQIPTLARKQSVSLKWCHLLPYPTPFWYLVSKKNHNYSVIIHLVRLLRCENIKNIKIRQSRLVKKISISFFSVLSQKIPTLPLSVLGNLSKSSSVSGALLTSHWDKAAESTKPILLNL